MGMDMGMVNLNLGMSMAWTTVTFQDYLGYMITLMMMMIYLYEG